MRLITTMEATHGSIVGVEGRIALPGGAVRELELVPTSVLPARMRGRDTSADMERTLPLDAVVEAWESETPD